MSKIFNDKHLQKLLSPKRLEMLDVDNVLKLTKVSEAKRLLDIGSGPGVFTLPASRLVTGTVTAVDTSPKMTDFLTERLNDERIDNVRVVTGTVKDLDDSLYDRTLLIHLIHEVADPSKFVAQITDRTEKDGMVTVLDWKKKAMEFGPSMNHRLSEDEVAELFNADYQEVMRQDWGPMFYLMIFRKL